VLGTFSTELARDRTFAYSPVKPTDLTIGGHLPRQKLRSLRIPCSLRGAGAELTRFSRPERKKEAPPKRGFKGSLNADVNVTPRGLFSRGIFLLSSRHLSLAMELLDYSRSFRHSDGSQERRPCCWECRQGCPPDIWPPGCRQFVRWRRRQSIVLAGGSWAAPDYWPLAAPGTRSCRWPLRRHHYNTLPLSHEWPHSLARPWPSGAEVFPTGLSVASLSPPPFAHARDVPIGSAHDVTVKNQVNAMRADFASIVCAFV